MTKPQPTRAVVNGLDTSILGGLAKLLETHPQGGKVTFATSTAWESGARGVTRTGAYRIDGETQDHPERRHAIGGDEPREFGASDSAAAPPEMLMHAVAHCVLATTNAYAALQGVPLTRLEADVEADVDLHGMFGLGGDVRPGLGALRIDVRIAGAASGEVLEGLVRKGLRHSPIRDSVEQGVPMQAQIDVQAF